MSFSVHIQETLHYWVDGHPLAISDWIGKPEIQGLVSVDILVNGKCENKLSLNNSIGKLSRTQPWLKQDNPCTAMMVIFPEQSLNWHTLRCDRAHTGATFICQTRLRSIWYIRTLWFKKESFRHIGFLKLTKLRFLQLEQRNIPVWLRMGISIIIIIIFY